jgi:hypothetical protein
MSFVPDTAQLAPADRAEAGQLDVTFRRQPAPTLRS